MKKVLHLFLSSLLTFSVSSGLQAQTCEWRLTNPTYNSNDPDGAGPAKGSVTFTLQIHTVSGTINNVNTISLGWSYQSANAMVPTTPGCAIVSNPANVVVSPAFTSGGFAYTTVNQCGVFSQTAGGQTFDRRAVGTLDGSSINLTTTWVDVFTVTLWTLASTVPEGGYVIINSGAGGTPGAFPTYAVADVDANEYVVNSLTYTTPLMIGSAPLPVTFTHFDAKCTTDGTLLTWQTLTESNSDRFEIEKNDGTGNWNVVGTIKAAGNSSSLKQYTFSDPAFAVTTLYRLRQLDKDGKFTYSPIVKTNCLVKTPKLTVYPIPATNSLNVVLTLESNSRTSIKLLDVAGKIHQSVEKDLLKGRNQVTLDVSRLGSGQYILRIEDGGRVQTEKIMIK